MLVFTKRFGVAGAPEIVQLMKTVDTGGYAELTDKYTGSEELACVLWPGDDRAQTTTLTATWDDAALGTVKIEFPLLTMQALEVTWYSGMLKLADGSDDLAVFRLQVEAGPGTATAPAVYHTYKDLTDELPFVSKLASYLEDQSGFIEVAAEARKWIDGVILQGAFSTTWGLVTRQHYWDWNFSTRGCIGPDPVVVNALDADQLVLTTAGGRRIVRASVYWTLGKILRRAVGMQTTNDLLTMADRYDRMANNELMSATAELGAGNGRRFINLGVTNTRRT